MEFTSNNNKGLIWNLLLESNIFNGIDNNKYSKIQNMFEETINNVNNNYSNNSLVEKNKTAMEALIFKINKEKENPKSKNNSDKPIELVYTSNDLSNQRKENFNNKLKEQQDNLNTYINPKIPEEPKFTDSADKPIGDDMDRLIAERMASREKELDVPKISKEAEQWINNSKEIIPLHETSVNKDIKNENSIPLSNNDNNDNNDKKVTFNLLENNNQEINNGNIIPIINNNNSNNSDSIFSKLKKKSDVVNKKTNDIIDNNELITRKEFELLRENQEKILNLCNTILNKL
tara:strand:- start:41 stop:910 length:870 start_codon:yes stop_codon:yes gene_type:complete